MLIRNMEYLFLSLIEVEIVSVFLKEGGVFTENKDSIEI